MSPRPTKVLVERLVEQCNPFAVLAFLCNTKSAALMDVDFYEPIDAYVPTEKRADIVSWHAGRIRYFRDRYLAGHKPTPIEVDIKFGRNANFESVVILDGHHRLAGAHLAKVEKIPVFYGGYVSILDYLRGRRKTFPFWG